MIVRAGLNPRDMLGSSKEQSLQHLISVVGMFE